MYLATIRNCLVILLAFAASCSNGANNDPHNAATNHGTTANHATHDDVGGPDAGPDAGTRDMNAALPDEAYAWSLPAGATQTDASTFARRLAAGELLAVSRATLRGQAAARETGAIGDRQTIADFLLRRPEAEFVWPEPDDDGAQGDGNRRVDWQTRDGASRVVQVHGERWAVGTVAEALRIYPTRTNQDAMYEAVWADFPPDLRGGLELPEPSTLGQYSDLEVQGYNDVIAGYALEIAPPRFDFSPRPAGYPASCEDEVGAVAGSDRTGDCAPSPDGVFARHYWPTKWFNTCIKDQGNRGTCIAMATTSAIEQRVARRDNQWVNLSEQALYNKMKLNWHREDYWDGYYSAQLAYQLDHRGYHVPYEQRWPYNLSLARVDGVERCKETMCDPNSTWCKGQCADNEAWWYYLFSCEDYAGTCGDSSHQTRLVCYQELDGSYHCGFELPDQNVDGEGFGAGRYSELWDHADRELSFARVILHLFLQNPVVATMPLYESFWDATPNGGWIPMPDTANERVRGAHGMHILWYVDNDVLAEIAPDVPAGAGGGYFIVKNSWSNCFGDGGYVYIPYDYITTYAYDVVAYHELQ